MFIVAASTDWVDGYWARKYGQMTQLGRILDPFADKMIICGTFIFLAAAPQLPDGTPASGVVAWMATVILAPRTRRDGTAELHRNQRRRLFSQVGWQVEDGVPVPGGRVQHREAAVVRRGDQELWRRFADVVTSGVNVTLWVALALTIYSGLEYIWVSVKVLKRMDGDGVARPKVLRRAWRTCRPRQPRPSEYLWACHRH